MANQHRGEYEFAAGGHAFRLRFDTNAICEAEGALGKTIVEITSEIGEGKVSMTVVRALLWAGLRNSRPTLTLQGAGELIEVCGGMFPVWEEIAKAFVLAFPAATNPTMESSQANGADGIGLDSLKIG